MFLKHHYQKGSRLSSYSSCFIFLQHRKCWWGEMLCKKQCYYAPLRCSKVGSFFTAKIAICLFLRLSFSQLSTAYSISVRSKQLWLVEVESGASTRGSYRRGGTKSLGTSMKISVAISVSCLLPNLLIIKLVSQLNHHSISELANISLRIKQMYSTCHLKERNPQVPRYRKVFAEHQSFCSEKSSRKLGYT